MKIEIPDPKFPIGTRVSFINYRYGGHIAPPSLIGVVNSVNISIEGVSVLDGLVDVVGVTFTYEIRTAEEFFEPVHEEFMIAKP